VNLGRITEGARVVSGEHLVGVEGARHTGLAVLAIVARVAFAV
jgi:hypothetical protein